ncbi:hypothetical protein D4R54_01630 [archaeon]|nr:MAG: hypothetical protein D4R54_01630 [archaeon]
MSDASGRRDIREEDSLEADGLQGFPKETGTERSEVEARGFKSHPRRFLTNPLGSFPLGEIVSFGLWMQKQGYRTSTTHLR